MNTWFDKATLPRRQRAERRAAPELAAYHTSGSGLKLDTVKDISATGVYLLTEERWLPGELVSLTLQRKGPPEKSPDRRITLKMMTVRWGEDGVALSFVLPKDLDLRLWDSPLKGEVDLTEPEDILREFRLADALAFLNRICPAEDEEIRRLLREGLSNYRVASAVEIVLKAREMVAKRPSADRLRANPRIIVRILEDGSWAENESTQKLWAGLLATSCTFDGKDESNMSFVDLLSQLATIHINIFTTACAKATKVMSSLGRVSSRPLVCKAEEIMKITGSRDLIRIERDLEHLSDLGLLEKKIKSKFFTAIDDAKITPTSLGLQLYARCNGHRGEAQDFYEVDSPAESILASEQ